MQEELVSRTKRYTGPAVDDQHQESTIVSRRWPVLSECLSAPPASQRSNVGQYAHNNLACYSLPVQCQQQPTYLNWVAPLHDINKRNLGPYNIFSMSVSNNTFIFPYVSVISSDQVMVVGSIKLVGQAKGLCGDKPGLGFQRS